MGKIIPFRKITQEYLQTHNFTVFVFGDNLLRIGTGGAAKLRSLPNTHGFITKKKPTNDDDAFFAPEEYLPVFEEEIKRLKEYVKSLPNTQFLISKVGAGLANKYHIFEEVIRDRMVKEFTDFDNVYFLWD